MKKPLALVLSLALTTIPLAVPAYADTLTAATDTTAATTTTDTSAANSPDITTTSGTTNASDTTSSTASSPTDGTSTTSTTTTTDGNTVTATPVDSTTGTTSTSTDSTNTALPPVQDSTGQTVEPGTSPDSPFYWLTSLIQKLQLAFTFDPAQKAALEEKFALQNLATARDLLNKGKQAPAQKALEDYAQKIASAQDFLNKIDSSSKDFDAAKFQILQDALAKISAKNIQVLGGLLDKLPPQAAQKVALNVVRSMEKAVDKLQPKEKQEVDQEMDAVAKRVGDSNLDEQTKEALANFQKALGEAVKVQKENQGQEKKEVKAVKTEKQEHGQDQKRELSQENDEQNTPNTQVTTTTNQQTVGQTQTSSQNLTSTPSQTQNQLNSQVKAQPAAQNSQGRGNALQTRPNSAQEHEQSKPENGKGGKEEND